MPREEVIKWLDEALYWIDEVAGSDREADHIQNMLKAIEEAHRILIEEK